MAFEVNDRVLQKDVEAAGPGTILEVDKEVNYGHYYVQWDDSEQDWYYEEELIPNGGEEF